MQIKYKNVGNVKEATITIEENKLNVKYGHNGTGKSTISKSLYDLLTNEDIIEKYRTFGSTEDPIIELEKPINDVMLFDDTYVTNFLFNDDDVNNTSEIIALNEGYKKAEEDIAKMLRGIRMVLATFPNLQKFKDDINGINNQLDIKDRKLNGKKSVPRALKNGNVINSISDDDKRKKYLLEATGSKYKKWISEGASYKKVEECPYCLQETDEERNNEITLFETLAGKATDVKNVLDRNELLNCLAKYVNDDDKKELETLVGQTTKIQPQQEQIIIDNVLKLTDELNKIDRLETEDLSNLSSALMNGKLVDYLYDNQLDVGLFNTISTEFGDFASIVNKEIDNVLASSTVLINKLYEMNNALQDGIKKNKDYVNDFLKYAGMPYKLDIVKKDGAFKSVLFPINVLDEVEQPKEHLSYGEKNALSMLLFALNAATRNPDLIILDDPISSFDDSKKYAILHQLFSYEPGVENLRGKTVLMLTHDFNIVIDLMKLELPKMNADLKCAHYLKNTDAGLEEIPITWKTIKNGVEVAEDRAKNTSLSKLLRVVSARRFLELKAEYDDKEALLSQFIHAKKKPEKWSHGKFQYYIDVGNVQEEIKEIILPDFDYYGWLDECQKSVIDDYKNAKSNYEKLVLARFYIISNRVHVNTILMNYISETYHIENDSVYCLDDDVYNSIPNYIIKMCDEIVLSE